MTRPTNNAHRRYFVDAAGRRVLIGLTREETFEFERLDSRLVLGPVDGKSEPDHREIWLAAGEQRWVELHEKHEGAWKAWMVQNAPTNP